MQLTRNCGSEPDDRKVNTSQGAEVRIFSSLMRHALSLELAVIACNSSRRSLLWKYPMYILSRKKSKWF